MAGDAFRKVRPGDPLLIPAAAYNAFLDAAGAISGSAHDLAARRGRASARTVLLKNASGADRPRFAVLGISEVLLDPAESLAEFQNTLALVGELPAADEHEGRFAVLAEPIPDGRIGRGWVDGPAICQLSVGDEGHGFAEISDGDAAKLASGATGSARILWKQPGTGTKWAVLLLGMGGAGGAMPDGTADQQILVWETDLDPDDWKLLDRGPQSYQVLQVKSTGKIWYDWVRFH